MTEPDDGGVASTHVPNKSPEETKVSSTMMCNIVRQISMEEIHINETKILPVKNEYPQLSGDNTEDVGGHVLEEPHHFSHSAHHPSLLSLEIVEDETSERMENSSLSEKSSIYIDISPSNEECPISCKRLKVEIDDFYPIGENNEDALKTLKEPKPSCVPQQLLKLVDNDPMGVVAVRCPLTILSQMAVQSKVVTVLGVRWCIFVRTESDYVSLFLKCLEEDEEFACTSLALSYKVHHPTDCEFDITKTTNHVFSPKENDWGYKHFLKSKELSDFIHSDGTIFFSCEFLLCKPQGLRFLNEDTRIPIGLVNQGATCYMNAAIQILFSTKCLRKAILELEFEKDDKGVVQSLQKLFYHLHTSFKAVSTEDLTNSFGWKNTSDSFTQHDVQEMMKILLEKIEMAFKGTQNEWMVDDLFKTKTRTFIKCLDVDFESGRDEYCLDIQLPVKRQNGSDSTYDVLSALREVTRLEVMDGDNKYEAEGHGLTRATKGSKFKNFSKILHLQLLRFQLDWESGESLKAHDRVEFSDILDLSEFIEDEDNGMKHEYALHGVITHSGKLSGGHYVTYICKYPGADQQKWFRFDDSTVEEVTKEYVMSEEHFGGGMDDSFTAYMLTYIRTDMLREVLDDFSMSAFSPRLRGEMELERRLIKWNEMDRERKETGTVLIRFVREPNPLDTQVWDHFNHMEWTRDPYRFKLRNDDPAIKLFHEAEELVCKSNLRLFIMEKRDGNEGEIWRVKRELDSELVEIQMRTVQSILGDEGNDEYVVFIMSNKPITLRKLTNEIEVENGSGKIAFIKRYNGDTHSMDYISPLEVFGNISLSRHVSESVCICAHIPPSSHLQFWKEKSLVEFEKMDDLSPIEVEMGDIIVFELVHLIAKDRYVQSLLQDSRQIKVFFKQCNNNLCYGLVKKDKWSLSLDPIVSSMNCTYRGLVEQLSRRIDHPSEMIIICVNGKIVDMESLNNKIIDSVVDIEKCDPRDQATVWMEFACLSVTIEQSLHHCGFKTAVRIGVTTVSTTEYLTKGSDILKRLKERLVEKYEMANIERLRLVWRSRQGMGHFVFREIGEDEDIMQTMLNARFSHLQSLIVCVDEKCEEEMEEMEEGEDDDNPLIVPIVFVKNLNVKNFTDEEVTIFIKIQKGDDNFSLKTKIEAKCGIDSMDWENMNLFSFMGSRCHSFQLKPRLGLNSLYDELREEPGLSKRRDTRLCLALHQQSVDIIEEESPLRLSQSILIRD